MGLTPGEQSGLLGFADQATSAYAEASIASGFVRVDDAEVPGGSFSATKNGQNSAIHEGK